MVILFWWMGMLKFMVVKVTCLMSPRQDLNPTLTLKPYITYILDLAYVRLESDSDLTPICPSLFWLCFLKPSFKYFTLAKNMKIKVLNIYEILPLSSFYNLIIREEISSSYHILFIFKILHWSHAHPQSTVYLGQYELKFPVSMHFYCWPSTGGICLASLCRTQRLSCWNDSC